MSCRSFIFFLRGGLLGLGHINKGTPEMGHKRSSFGLLMLDLVIVKGFRTLKW